MGQAAVDASPVWDKDSAGYKMLPLQFSRCVGGLFSSTSPTTSHCSGTKFCLPPGCPVHQLWVMSAEQLQNISHSWLWHQISVPQEHSLWGVGFRSALSSLMQQSPTFLAPGTGFMEDNFSMEQESSGMVLEWFKCTAFIFVLYFYYYYISSSSGIISGGWGPLPYCTAFPRSYNQCLGKLELPGDLWDSWVLLVITASHS